MNRDKKPKTKLVRITNRKPRLKFENLVNIIGHFLYIRLLPFPKLRNVLSVINGKIKIFKNPEVIKGIAKNNFVKWNVICHQENLVTLIYEVQNMEEAEKAILNFWRFEWKNKTAILLVSEKSQAARLREILIRYNMGDIGVISKHYCLTYQDVLNIYSRFAIWADISLKSDYMRNYEEVINQKPVRKNQLYSIENFPELKSNILKM